MKKTFKILCAIAILATFTISCREKTTGEKIKDGVEEVGDGIEDAAEDAGDAVKDATN
ncbi:hypothetical protein GCM10022393_01760 [Aquimarina addita]|uniref:Entericidin EcnAB n=1 Tax=Aquimarina addita TaxID=870485 RepID=A0ABP7X811_9FLAO